MSGHTTKQPFKFVFKQSQAANLSHLNKPASGINSLQYVIQLFSCQVVGRVVLFKRRIRKVMIKKTPIQMRLLSKLKSRTISMLTLRKVMQKRESYSATLISDLLKTLKCHTLVLMKILN